MEEKGTGKCSIAIDGKYLAGTGYGTMKISVLLVGLLVVALTGAGMVSAEADSNSPPAFPGQPQLPHSFYGTLEAAGNPVPAGVPVEAIAEGVVTGLAGNPIYSREGRYGSVDPLTPRLEVQGTLATGTGIAFSIGGIRAEVQAGGSGAAWTSSYPFKPGEVTELNLRIAQAVTPVPGYVESPKLTLAATPVVTTTSQVVNPSTDMMLVLISVLVVLGIVAYYLGRRAEKKKTTPDQDAGKEDEEKPEE